MKGKVSVLLITLLIVGLVAMVACKKTEPVEESTPEAVGNTAQPATEAPPAEQPAPAAEQPAPATAPGSTAPAPAAGSTAPAPAAGSTAPAPAAGSTAPAPAAGSTAPAAPPAQP